MLGRYLRFALLLPALMMTSPFAGDGSSGPHMYFDSDADRRMARAVASGDIATIRSLVGNGVVSPIAVGRDATSWLVIAVAARQKRSLDVLLELGAMDDPKGRIAGQALYAATIQQDLYWLRRLHAAGADLNNRGGGELLLAVAMNTGRRATLEYYLTHGADLEQRTTSGGTVVLAAADLERFDLVNEFLDRGASPWVMDSFGATLGYAAEEPARSASWIRGSAMDSQRETVLRRLHVLGFPDPAPTPDEGFALRERGSWPPPGSPPRR